MCASYLLQQHFSHLSDDRETKSVLCRLVLFISSVMKSPRAEQWAVMPLLNADLGSPAEAAQRHTNAQADDSCLLNATPPYKDLSQLPKLMLG